MIRVSRPAEVEPEDDSTFWLITYSDMITLLLSFFLLMFSFTLLSQEKQDELLRVLNKVEKPKEDKKKEEEAIDLEAKARQMAAQMKEAWVETSETEITVGVPSSVTFASGEAALTPAAREPLEKIAEILRTVPNAVRVEGHTDNVPMRGAKFPSNWHLSAARAQSVVRLFQEKGLDPRKLLVVGFGETRPRRDNATEDGRAANRRIEIKLLRPEAGTAR
ncbi:MAG TPA: OmpA family protein [Myxococcales bacterium]|jgi:chemotaxis protein MotB